MIWPTFSAAAVKSFSLSFKVLLSCLLFFFAWKIISKASLYLKRRQFQQIHGCKPCVEFPLKDRILGLDFVRKNVEAVSKDQFLQLMYDRMIEAGATWQVRVFGTRRSTFTADPENIQTIMSLKFDDYKLAGRRRIMSPLLGHGVFTSDDEEWKHSRALLRPHFQREQVTDLALVELHLEHLFGHLPQDGSTVDLTPLFHRFTLDSATHFLFGKSTNTLTNASAKDIAFAKALRYSLDHIALLLVAGRLSKFWKTDPKFDESNRICREYVGTYVTDVMRYKHSALKTADAGKKPQRSSFLQDLAASSDDEVKIQGDLLSLLLAGRDTTASLLCSLFWQLSRNPDAWNILSEEIKHIGGEKPTYEQLKGLKYARYCVNEVLRLHPPVPTSAKVAQRDTVLPRGGGADGKSPILIPAGRKVFWSSYAAQRNPATWGPDAEEFRPERWETARPSWNYIPFNGGPRTCIGQNYAVTETLYVIVRIVQKFESVEARDNLPWTGTLGLTVHPSSVKVGLQRRDTPCLA